MSGSSGLSDSSGSFGIVPVDGLSHVQGECSRPLSALTLPALLAATVARWPQRDAVVLREQGLRWNWAQFALEIDRLADGLRRLGLVAGDRVGIWSPNRAEWLVTQFATARLGLILVNINPAYRLAELEYALRLAGCRAVIAAERLRGADYLAMLAEVAPRLPALPTAPSRKHRPPRTRRSRRPAQPHRARSIRPARPWMPHAVPPTTWHRTHWRRQTVH